MGDYHLFLAWDGAQGYVDPDGNVEHYPDTWTFAPWSSEPTYMRDFQRTELIMLSTYGESYLHPDNGETALWPVIEGDISVVGGLVYQP